MRLLGWDTVGRDDPNYKACASLATAIGAVAGGATGSFLGPAGTVAGYAGGAAWGLAGGYLACPYLVPALKRKIESGMPLTNAEVRSAAEALGQYARVRQATDAVKLLAMVRISCRTGVGSSSCHSPALTARQLLSRA